MYSAYNSNPPKYSPQQVTAGYYDGMPGQTTWTFADRLGVTNQKAGDDLLLTNVISFDIKVLQQGFPTTVVPATAPFTFIDLPSPINFPTVYNNPFLTNAASGNVYCVFDTWAKTGVYNTGTNGKQTNAWFTKNQETSVPLKIRILAIQITLRVYDDHTNQSRQLSIVQDM